MRVKRFEINEQGKDYIVGDLHGCYEDFLLALKAVGFDENIDRMFSVGDLVDRGPDSYECAQLIYKPWFHAVRGNHEDLMIRSILDNNDTATGVWLSNGGQWIYKKGTWEPAYTQDQLKRVANDLNQLPYVIVVGEDDQRFNVVHAEFLRDKGTLRDEGTVGDEDIDQWTFNPLEEYSMLWGRSIVQKDVVREVHKDLSLTYVGHTPIRQVLRAFQQIYIDTGCVYSVLGYARDAHVLSIACPQEQVIYQWSPVWKRLTTVQYSDIPDIKTLVNTR